VQYSAPAFRLGIDATNAFRKGHKCQRCLKYFYGMHIVPIILPSSRIWLQPSDSPRSLCSADSGKVRVPPVAVQLQVDREHSRRDYHVAGEPRLGCGSRKDGPHSKGHHLQLQHPGASSDPDLMTWSVIPLCPTTSARVLDISLLCMQRIDSEPWFNIRRIMLYTHGSLNHPPVKPLTSWFSSHIEGYLITNDFQRLTMATPIIVALKTLTVHPFCRASPWLWPDW